MSNDNKGTVFCEKIYHVSCVRCGCEQTTVDAGTVGMTFLKAIRLFASDGWRIRKGGWTCPACIAKESPHA